MQRRQEGATTLKQTKPMSVDITIRYIPDDQSSERLKTMFADTQKIGPAASQQSANQLNESFAKLLEQATQEAFNRGRGFEASNRKGKPGIRKGRKKQ